MKIIVLSQAAAEKFTSEEKWAVISITSPGEDLAIFQCPNLLHILRLQFDDINKIEDGFRAFWRGDAEETWDFYDSIKDEVSLLVVHCLAGQCRSPGIAAGLEKVLTGTDEVWFKTKTPNSRVHRAMVKVGMERLK